MGYTIRRLAVLLAMVAIPSVAVADPIVDAYVPPVGPVPIGGSERMPGAVGNLGDAPLAVTRLEIVGPDASRFRFANPAGPTCNGGQVCDDPFVVPEGTYTGVDILCVPDWSGTFSATFVVTSNATSGAATYPLDCDAPGPPVDFSPRTLTFPTTRINYWSPPQVVQIHNLGDAPVAYTLQHASSFVDSLDGRCDHTDPCYLFPGETWSLSLTFTPHSTGSIVEYLMFETVDGVLPVQLTGTAFGPDLTIEAPDPRYNNLYLGHVALGGTTAPGTVRIRNTGDEPLHVAFAGPQWYGSESVVVVGGPSGPFDVAPDATVEWQVACRALRADVVNSGWFVIENNSGTDHAIVPVSCISDVDLYLDSASVDLPATATGTSSTRSVVLHHGNTAVPVTLTALTSSDGQLVATLHGVSLPITLTGTDAVTIDVTFMPTAGGDRRAEIAIVNSTATTPVVIARGYAVSERVDIEPTEPAFGHIRVGAPTTLIVGLRNNASQVVTTTSIVVSDPAQFEVVDDLVGVPLPPALGTGVQLRATLASLGPHDATITFTFDHGPPTILHVTAIGVAPELAVSTWDDSPTDNMFEFATTAPATTAMGLISVTNTGTATLRIAACEIVGDPAFSLATACPIELAPHASADLALGFAPTTTALATATLRFTSDASTPMLDISLAGNAPAVAPALPPSGGGCSAGRDGGGVGALIAIAMLGLARRRRRAVAAVLALGACGAPDLVLSHDGAPIASWDTGTLMIGKQRSIVVEVTNAGTAPSDALAASSDVTAYTIAPSSPCLGANLAPGASCELAVVFAPTALDPAAGTIVVAGTTDQVSLAVAGVGAAQAVVLDPAVVDFGGAPVGAGSQRTVRVINADAGPTTIGSVTATGTGFAVTGNACTTPLAPDATGTCEVTLAYAPTSIGAATGELVVTSAGTTAHAPLGGLGGGIIHVTREGGGDGVVSSLAPGIDCGAACSAAFYDQVHLAAVAEPGSVFLGWDGPCAGTGPCVLPPAASPTEVVARFEHQFRLTVAGASPMSPFSGEVTVDGEPCPLPCVRDVVEGTTVTLDAFTLSSFTGWTGGCAMTPTTCTVTVTADVDLVAHFDADAGERWIAVDDELAAPEYVTLAGDDPVVAGADGDDLLVARYASTGTRTWLTRIAIGPRLQIVGLAADAIGDVYVLTHQWGDPEQPFTFGTVILRKLAATGQALWAVTESPAMSIPLPADLGDRSAGTGNDGLAVTPSGDVIAFIAFAVRAYAGDGTLLWSAPQSNALDVSVGSDGVIAVASMDDNMRTERIDRYAPDGTVLGGYFLPALDETNFEFFYRAFAIAGEELIAASSSLDGAGLTIRAVDTAGEPTWSLGMGASSGTIALEVDGQGNLVTLDGVGAVRKQIGPTVVWRRTPSHYVSPGGEPDGAGVSAVGGDSQGRVVEVGSWGRGCGRTCPPRRSGFVRSFLP